MLVKVVAEKSQIFADYAHQSSVADASSSAIDAGGAAMEELRGIVARG